MPTLTETEFGRMPDGRPVKLYEMTARTGHRLRVIDYGLIITEWWVPDRTGNPANVVLGFDNLPRYLQGHPFFGAIAGRVANRIARGRFTIDDREYRLATNNGHNHLHGGYQGFDKQLWHSGASSSPTPGEAGLEFSLLSPDGNEGYPGNLAVRVLYRLDDTGSLQIDYEASTDFPTPVNLTNHSYFNLAGAGDVLGHELEIRASRYTPTDEGLIPTGELASVENTPLDFRSPTPIGARHLQTGLTPPGYDHNYALDVGGGSLALAARAREPKSGRVLEVWTTEPGVQLYTANNLDGTIRGHGGQIYPRYAGFCLETQHFPDAINKPQFPSVILRPGATYRSTSVYRFPAILA